MSDDQALDRAHRKIGRTETTLARAARQLVGTYLQRAPDTLSLHEWTGTPDGTFATSLPLLAATHGAASWEDGVDTYMLPPLGAAYDEQYTEQTAGMSPDTSRPLFLAQVRKRLAESELPDRIAAALRALLAMPRTAKREEQLLALLNVEAWAGWINATAVTESVAGYNAATLDGATAWQKLTGIRSQSQWRSTMDGRTRAAHRMANYQTVPTGTPFLVGGEMLRYPGDPNGSPGTTIHCRCVLLELDKDSPLLLPSPGGSSRRR
ncbi:hypothetical protein [Streptomyces sp. NBC_01304]|uniref:hypothetical protein n=1 Tax=Streptomyces sp. NBC_01304 TaxID=2903818 RepID=UPI002E0F7B6D|nr:phage head morphogenesis protein [Streptomyces sp. NBC_01304]